MTRAGDTPGGLGEIHDAAAGRQTSPWVRFQDRAAQITITSGGVAVVLAMLGICVFLVVSAAPLFMGGRVTGETARFRVEGATPAWASVDAPFNRIVSLGVDGMFTVRSLATGEVLATVPAMADGSTPTAIRSEAGRGWLTLTGEGGAFDIVRPEMSWTVLGPVSSTAEPPASDAGYVETMADGTRRLWTVTVRRLGPFRAGDGVVAVDSRGSDERVRHVVALTETGVRPGTLRGRRALGADTMRYSLRMEEEIALTDLPSRAYASDSGRWVFLVDRGEGVRVVDLEAEGETPRVVRVPLEARATAAAMALGSESLLIGDERGVLTTWTGPGVAEVRGPSVRRDLGDAPIVSIRPGDRDRTVVAGLSDGSAVMYNTLSDKIIARVTPEGLDGLALAAGAPASDSVLMVGSGGEAAVYGVEPGHTGASFRTLFGKVQYEGYDEPEYVYQSTGLGGAEPKFSLVPLIFGTLKATVVAMLFAAPLAVLAAIYSSEFLDQKVRRYFKPTIELMASLPSVVLGFMAAMVVAPFVRDHLPAVLTVGVTGPLVVVLMAHAWRLIPMDRRAAMGPGVQFGVIVAAVAGGVGLAAVGGDVVQSVLFSPGDGGPGSIRGWLNGDFGGATPGWFVVMLLPVTGLLLIADATALAPFWRRLGDRTGAAGRNAWEFARLAANLAAAGAAAWLAAIALDAAGFDPRDSVFGPFSQRNTLVVGVIMGIAVIPIIYTISEDAIRSVPDSLRSASLGVGATTWQTAVRVVLPVAGSGVFSACMIGLGRAVGETMIVLMATGNTPEMSMNIFSGFRTLAANIAVELPEAPRASTHYRVLFLCGLVLFAMTLVINTSAELVRQHFRKRNRAL